MELTKLRAKLLNWGEWLNWEADIGPKGARCISIESRHLPDTGEVWEADQSQPTPNVPEAELMEFHIRKLDCIQQYALAVTYGGAPSVMRFRRMGEHMLKHNLELAELMLYQMIKEKV